MTSPPESARVVVVGAGIAGAGVAHHLAERGWDEIVVVDQGPLFETGGSTSHAAAPCSPPSRQPAHGSSRSPEGEPIRHGTSPVVRAWDTRVERIRLQQ